MDKEFILSTGKGYAKETIQKWVEYYSKEYKIYIKCYQHFKKQGKYFRNLAANQLKRALYKKRMLNRYNLIFNYYHS